MSQTLNLPNYKEINILQTTRLSALTPAGSAILPVINNAGFAATDYTVLGDLGSDGTEPLTVSSITGGKTITPTASTIFDHPAYDYLNKLFGNKIRIYRAANVSGLQPIDANFTLVATVDISFDREFTQYTDATGSNAYWYKFTYYNSTSSTETDIAASSASRGGSTGNYCSIEDIREEAGFKNAPYVTDAMIDRKRLAAQNEVNGRLHGFYTVPFVAPINPFIADITTRLSAGLLLVEQYSQTNTQNTADGQKKIEVARADLESLATKQVELIDTAGNSTAGSGSTGGVSGWPNSTTASASKSSGGAPRLFRMGDIQGQETIDSSGNPSGNLYYGRKW